MRLIEDIQADYEMTQDKSYGAKDLCICLGIYKQLYADIPNLLAALAEKDAEIERLKAAAERFSRKIAGLPE